MDILMITPRFPFPPDKGDRLTIFNYLKYFSKNHRVILLTFIKEKEIPFMEEVSRYCSDLFTVSHSLPKAIWNCGHSIFGTKPFQISYYWNQSEIKRKIDDLIEENSIDIIYCHTIRMAEYVMQLKGIPKILAMQISMGLNYRRFKEYSRNSLEKLFYSFEHTMVKNYEYNITNYFDKVLLISKKDFDEIQKNGSRKINNVHFLPHGVDHRYFRPLADTEKDAETIIITGNMGYPPNCDAVYYFFEDIFPLIKKRKPNCKLWIVGKNPPERMKKFGKHPNINVTGEVKDLRPYLSKAAIGVAPTRIAAGLQNKLLEGMSMGLPMVATSNANEGIGATDGKEVLIADNPEDIANSVLGLFKSKYRRETLGKNSRSFIERQFTWDFFLRDLENLMASMVNK